MYFPTHLQSAILIKRYKRFLADVKLDNGEIITIHCANTGAMTGCANEGDIVWFSISNNSKRKYPLSWELTQTHQNDWICVNTIRANQIVKEAIVNNELEEFLYYNDIKSEVKYGLENSRIDLLLTNLDQNACYIEVKSVTFCNPINKFGYFPDAITNRGQKHLRELINIVNQGKQAVVFFLVLHTGIDYFSPANNIDTIYSSLLKQAHQCGVKLLCYKTDISTKGIRITEKIPIIFND